MTENLPALKLKWGFFCRGVAQEPEDGNLCAWSIMPAIKGQVILSDNEEERDIKGLPFDIWTVTCFEIERPAPRDLSYKLEFMFHFGGRKMADTVEFLISTDERIAIVNLHVPFPDGVMITAGEQLFEVDIAQSGNKIARIDLPIDIQVQHAGNTLESK